VFLTPNQEYLVPYRTLKLLYNTVHMSLLGFLLQLEQCPVKLLSGDDPTKAESCFRIFTISEIALRVPIPSCRRDFALLAHHGLERGCRRSPYSRPCVLRVLGRCECHTRLRVGESRRNGESMTTGRLRYTCLHDIVADSSLQNRLVKMMAVLLASNSISIVLGSRKNPLPCPFSTRVGVLAF